MKLRVHIKLLCIIASAAALSACGAKPEAYIKEIEGDAILISSDSDEFPGAFLVDVSEHIENIGDYQSGGAVMIHMEDLGSKEQGME